MAWVTFDQHAGASGDPFDLGSMQHEMRILEKHDGAWRIAFVGVLESWLESADYPVVRIDPRGKVLWMNAAASEGLRAHAALVIGAGRLRARNRAGNKRLQAAIRWAAGATDPASRQAARRAVATVRGGALPVVLGEDDAAQLSFCWVTVEGGMIVVTFDDGHRMAQCLAAARVVYGLSAAQARLAALLLDGHELAAAAAELGISVNAARTHLQRMFDKAGVRSQPGLVRVL